MRLLCLIFLPLSLSLSANAVLFGHDASRGLNPEDRLIRRVTVKMVYDGVDGRPLSCTGVQIDPQTVLTAGHCLEAQTLAAMRRGRLFVEAYDASAPGQKRSLPVTSIEGGDGRAVDFAVIKFRGTLPSRQSVPLAFSGCDEDSPYLLAGFGVDETNGVTAHLMTAPFQLAHPLVASARARSFPSNSKRKYLSPAADARACVGDSGGPIFCLKHGMIALRGVLNTVHASMGPQSMRPDIPKNVYCRDWGTDIAITTVSDGMAEIERRRGSRPAARYP